MEILVFSDSHGNPQGMSRAYDRCPIRPSAVFFLGDGVRDLDSVDFHGTPIYAVRGNCDWYSIVPEEGVTALERHTILFVHGHRYRVKSGYDDLIRRGAELGADIVLFGHTHRPETICIPAGETIGGICLPRPMYLLNPGSIGSGGEGERTFGTLHLTPNTVLASHGKL